MPTKLASLTLVQEAEKNSPMKRERTTDQLRSAGPSRNLQQTSVPSPHRQQPPGTLLPDDDADPVQPFNPTRPIGSLPQQQRPATYSTYSNHTMASTLDPPPPPPPHPPIDRNPQHQYKNDKKEPDRHEHHR